MTIDVTPVNDAPTVVLANTTTTLPEDTDTSSAIKVADIVITDDALGTNSLSLSGADAALFQIVGTELFLVAGAVLNFGTNPVLDVTVEVDDLAIGATPDDIAALSIVITAGNSPPVAVDDAYTALEDIPFTAAAGLNDLLMNDSDVDGNPLTVNTTPLVAPVNGSVLLNPDGTFTYTPNPNFNGTDAFTYEISDGFGGLAQATAVITITPVNDLPTAVNDAFTAIEDTLLSITSGINGLLTNDSDVDGDTLTVDTIAALGPTSGTLLLNGNGTFTYTPNANFNGTDNFTYEISDGNGEVSQAIVSITVTSVNDAPVAVGNQISAGANISFAFSEASVIANDSDIDGDALTLLSFQQPTRGSLSSDGNGGLLYTPNPDFVGVDSFSYTVVDPSGAQSTAFMVINVSGNISGGTIGGLEPPPGSPDTNPAGPEPTTDDDEDKDDEVDATASKVTADAVLTDGLPSSLSGPQIGNDVPVRLASLSRGSSDADTDSKKAKAFAKYLYQTLGDLSQVFDIAGFNLHNVNLDNELFWEALDNMKRQMSGMDDSEQAQAIVMTQIAAGSGILLSAGYVSWILRGGALAAMLLSSIPTWAGFDPLPLLAMRKKKKKGDQEDDSYQYDSMLVEQIFSGDHVAAADIEHVKKS
jgi:VCBS repeat-containing protein